MKAGYAESLQRLYGLARVGEKYSLDGPRALISALNNPLERYDSILVGGTNGKGSTSHILARLLASADLKVGLFTSPHLVSYRERISVNGACISETDVCRLVEDIVPISEAQGFSFFETTWAMAAEYFRLQNVDIVVWEVGLGGRLDATNVCDPIGSIVTNIALDHTTILGDTLQSIAAEKAPIFRMGRPALTGDKASQLRLQACTECTVEFVPIQSDVPTCLMGAHQRINLSVAVGLLKRLEIPFNPAVLLDMSVPARLERIGHLIIDCAHNPHAVQTVLKYIEQLQAQDHRPLELVFGVMSDKAVEEMAALICKTGLPVHLVAPNYPRRLALKELVPWFEASQIRSQTSVQQFMETRREDRQYLVLGSSFLAAEVKSILEGVIYPECGIVTTAR